jgi:transcriptional regulator with XRE-family HTH domain
VHQLAEETRRYEAEIYRRRGETSLQSLGVSVSNISRYENGNYEKISFDQLWILLDVLKPLNSQAGKLMGLEDLLMIGTEELNIPSPIALSQIFWLSTTEGLTRNRF